MEERDLVRARLKGRDEIEAEVFMGLSRSHGSVRAIFGWLVEVITKMNGRDCGKCELRSCVHCQRGWLRMAAGSRVLLATRCEDAQPTKAS